MESYFVKLILYTTILELDKMKQKLWKFAIFRFLYFRFLGLYCDLYAESAVVSFQKSGLTWLRVMLAKIISLKYNIKKLDLDIIRMAKGKIPKIAIFHSLAGLPLYHWEGFKFTSIYSKSERVKIRPSLKNKKILFLVRDPRDVVVSLFFELTKRHHLYKGDISSFIREKYTLKKIIRYMNMWHKEMVSKPNTFLLIRYEDMKKNCNKELKKISLFLKLNVSPAIVNEAVKFGTIENMRKIEELDLFHDNRLRAKNPKDKESYKVRKGKAGGYTDYLSKEDVNYINERIDLNLHKDFGY